MVKRNYIAIIGVVGVLLLVGVAFAGLRSNKRGQSIQQEADGPAASDRQRAAATGKVKNPLDPASLTPLMLASLNGETQTVKALLAEGTSANQTNADGVTPLMCAAAKGHVNILRLLIEAGGQVNQRSRIEQTPLMFAAKYGQLDAAKLLIASGADVNAERHKLLNAQALEELYGEKESRAGEEAQAKERKGVARVSVFAEALTNNHPDVARLLLESGAAPKVLGEDGPNAALRLAARKGYVELIAPLIEKGAEVNRTGPLGRTVLMEAAGNGQAAVVESLLKQGASADLKDAHGQTALMLASQAGSAKGVEALLLNKAQLELMDTDGRTALMIAAENGRPEVVEALLKRGARKEVKDAAGKTAGERAQYNGHAEIAARLGFKATDTGKWPN